MKILVTGGAGFIGFNLVRLLNLHKHEITLLDSCNGVLYSSRLKSNRMNSLKKNLRIDAVSHDLSKKLPPDFLSKFDAIINLAALPGQLHSWDNLRNYMESNFLTVDTLLKNLIQNRLSPKIIHISTSSVYGSIVNTSISRKLDPCNPYGVTKLAAENLIRAYLNYYEFDVKIMRLFSVYGPHQRPDMGIHKFLRALKSGDKIQIYGDGNQKRQISFVGDVCEVVLNALNSKTDPNNYITDVSGPDIFTVNEIVEVCSKVTGVVPKIEFLKKPFGDQLNTQNPYTNAEQMFGFKNYTSITDGIKQQYFSLNEFYE